MYIVQRTLTFVNGLLKSYGPSNLKKILWDREFSGAKWDFIDHTEGDCVYPFLEKYARNGSILDLGCGPGNTANELKNSAYQKYVGVDISEAALAKGRKRTEEKGRIGKNHFICDDFINHDSTEQYDVILFRESMYHVPLHKVKATLDRLSSSLKPGGVFIVRMSTFSRDGKSSKFRPASMMKIMESEFDVSEKFQDGEGGPTVIVFRPRRAA